MNTYSWTITKLVTEQQNLLNDVVVEIHFTLTATNPTGEFTVELNSQANLVPASAEEFITWDQLDEATMIQWTKNCFTVEDYAKTLAGLDLQLIDQQTALLNSRVERTDLPWGSAPKRFPEGWTPPVMPYPEDYSPVDDAVESTDQ
jgi:hypothetical protein